MTTYTIIETHFDRHHENSVYTHTGTVAELAAYYRMDSVEMMVWFGLGKRQPPKTIRGLVNALNRRDHGVPMKFEFVKLF